MANTEQDLKEVLSRISHLSRKKESWKSFTYKDDPTIKWEGGIYQPTGNTAIAFLDTKEGKGWQIELVNGELVFYNKKVQGATSENTLMSEDEKKAFLKGLENISFEKFTRKDKKIKTKEKSDDPVTLPLKESEESALSLVTFPEEILAEIINLASEPKVAIVSQHLYAIETDRLRQKYNQTKTLQQPNLYGTKDDAPTMTTQQNEVEYFLFNKDQILKATNQDSEVIKHFAALEDKAFRNISPLETKKYLARENILDGLNAAIIEAKIKSTKGRQLNCSQCYLTRFPGKVITKHQAFFKTLQGLNLSKNTLQNLPPQIGQLTALHTLDLNYNGLQNLPPEIGNLKALQDLNLSFNVLQSLPPEIAKLTALSRLNLIHNQLKSLPPEIGKLEALQELYVNDNQLQRLPPEIGQLSALVQLYLNRNQLTSLPPEIRRLTGLLELLLNNNQLQSFPPEIAEFIALVQLDLSNNQIQSVPAAIAQLSALQWLGLDNNQLQNLPLEIGSVTTLERLDLQNNRLQGLPPELGQLAALQWLNVSHNQLKNLPTEILQLQVLQWLFLESNQLTNLPDALDEAILFKLHLLPDNSEKHEQIGKQQLLASQQDEDKSKKPKFNA